MRAGSAARSFHGSVSERYLLAAKTTSMALPMAAFCRLWASRAPTSPKPDSAVASTVWSMSSSSPVAGMAPRFLAVIDTVRFTRLPQAATSSSLLRRTNSAQVKSVSWFSGPAMARW